MARRQHPGEPHHWIIDAPDGPTCVGRCRHCGARREFVSAEPAALRWNETLDGLSGSRPPWRPKQPDRR